MSGKQVQRRRGTSTEHSTFIGAMGEVTVDTTTFTEVVHDGATPGGHRLAREVDLDVVADAVTDLQDGTHASTVSYSGGILDLSAKPPGAYLVNLNANISQVLLPPGVAGRAAHISLQFTQTGAGNFSVTGWPGTVVWAGGSAPLVNQGAGAITYMTLSSLDNGPWLGGQSSSGGSGGFLFSVQWCANRAKIPAGYVAADGQLLSRATYPDAWAGIQAANVPVVTEANWTGTPTNRGSYTIGDGSSTFRIPDYNGKSSGTLGACFLRGDGTLSAGTDGQIQQDAMQTLTGQLNVHGSGTATVISGGTGVFVPASSRASYSAPNVTAGATSYDAVQFSNAAQVRTAAENRPLNVTGCWVVKLFGAVINVGSLDAAQLASDVASLQTNKANLAGPNTYTGNAVYNGVGLRFQADFSSGIGVYQNRLSFQTTTVNGSTLVPVIPNGTSTLAGVMFHSSSTDFVNFNYLAMYASGNECRYVAGNSGSASTGYQTWYTNGAERMRIDSNGYIKLQGTSSTPVNSNVPGVAITTNGYTQWRSGSTTAVDLAIPAGSGFMFGFSAGTTSIGNISTNGTTTAYNTTSDYRLKENIADADPEAAYARICAVPMHALNFKADPDVPIPAAVLAHELQVTHPLAVTGYKDQVEDIGTVTRADGSVLENVAASMAGEGDSYEKTGERPIYQGVDYSKLVPDLVLCIQHQDRIIADLQARLASLEAAAP